MEKVVYNEESISTVPGSAHYYEHVQGLRDELSFMEVERDDALLLLREVAEADDSDELEDILARVREFVESMPYQTPY